MYLKIIYLIVYSLTMSGDILNDHEFHMMVHAMQQSNPHHAQMLIHLRATGTPIRAIRGTDANGRPTLSININPHLQVFKVLLC